MSCTNNGYTTVAGDTGKPMPVALKVNGSPMVIPVGSTVTMRWEKPDGTFTTVALADVDRTIGKFVYNWSAGDTDQVGAHFGQVVVTDASSKVVSYPDDGSRMIWTVYPSVGSASYL